MNYMSTLYNAISIASKLSDFLLRECHCQTLSDSYLKRISENYLAACIHFLSNYEVKPYDLKWNELVENKFYDKESGMVRYTYSDKEGNQKELYRKKGKYADLPHILVFFMHHVPEVLDCLVTNRYTESLVNPIISIWKAGDAVQVKEMLGPLQSCVARLMTPEIFWVLSGDDFIPDDRKNPTSRIYLCDDEAGDEVKALNELLCHVFKDKAVLMKTKGKGFFHKWFTVGPLRESGHSPLSDEGYMQTKLKDNYNRIFEETENIVRHILEMDDDTEVPLVDETNPDIIGDGQESICLGGLSTEELVNLFREETDCRPLHRNVYWTDNGTAYRFRGFSITRGCVHLYHGKWTDIDDLPVAPFVLTETMDAHPGPEGRQEFQGYYNMTPSMRYDYLRWLAGELPVDGIGRSLFSYFMCGIAYRLFMDSGKDGKANVLESLNSLWKEFMSCGDELKKESDIVRSQMESCKDDDFDTNYIISKWTGQANKIPSLEKLAGSSMMENYELLERRFKELEERIATIEQYASIIRNVMETADLMTDEDGNASGNDAYTGLLELSGEEYDDADVDEVRDIIRNKRRLYASDAYNLALALRLVDPADYSVFHLNVRKFFMQKFNGRYPDGLALERMDGNPVSGCISRILHLSEGYYKPPMRNGSAGVDGCSGEFRAGTLFDALKDLSDSVSGEMDIAFWAYMNAVGRNKGRATPFSLLCLPMEVSLVKMNVYPYLHKLADMMFQERKMITVRFRDLVHFLGYPLFPNEGSLKYYKATRLVEGLSRIGIRIYCKEISLKSGKVFCCRNIPLDTECILWREEIKDRLEKDEWDVVYNGLRDICKYILDSGNCTEDKLLVEKFTDNVLPDTLGKNMKVLLTWHTMKPRKYKRNKWTDKEYRKEVRKHIKAKLKALQKRIAGVEWTISR